MRKLCPHGQSYLVFHPDLWLGVEREKGYMVSIQVSVVHRYTGDLWVFIGGVIIDSVIGVAAACIDGFFEDTAYPCAAFLLGNRSKNVEKLIDRSSIVFFTYRVQFHKCCSYKTGGGGQIPRKPNSTHTPAVWWQFAVWSKAACWFFTGKIQISGKIVQVKIERWVVG